MDSVRNALDSWAATHYSSLAQRTVEVEEKARTQDRIAKSLQDTAREKQDYINQTELASQKLQEKYDEVMAAIEEQNKMQERLSSQIEVQQEELKAMQEAEAERLGQETCPAFSLFKGRRPIPSSVLASIFSYLSTTDLDSSIKTCKLWKHALLGANVWKLFAIDMCTRSLLPPEELSSTEMTHKHYCLIIEIGKDTYVVNVNVTEVSSGACRSVALAAQQSKVESDRNRIVITVCSLNTANLMDEAVFCSALVTEHTGLTQAKLDKAKAEASLDDLLGLKQLTSQEIATATTVAQQVETAIEHVQMQHQSDEFTTQLLEEELATVETRVMASEMETTNTLQFLAKEIKAKNQMLVEFEEKSGDSSNSAAAAVAQEYDSLKQQKAILTRELKSLKEKVESVRKDRNQAEANYLTVMRNAPAHSPITMPSSPLYAATASATGVGVSKLSIASSTSSPPSSNPPSPSASSRKSSVTADVRKSSFHENRNNSFSEQPLPPPQPQPRLSSSSSSAALGAPAVVNMKMPKSPSLLSVLNPFASKSNNNSNNNNNNNNNSNHNSTNGNSSNSALNSAFEPATPSKPAFIAALPPPSSSERPPQGLPSKKPLGGQNPFAASSSSSTSPSSGGGGNNPFASTSPTAGTTASQNPFASSTNPFSPSNNASTKNPFASSSSASSSASASVGNNPFDEAPSSAASVRRPAPKPASKNPFA